MCRVADGIQWTCVLNVRGCVSCKNLLNSVISVKLYWVNVDDEGHAFTVGRMF